MRKMVKVVSSMMLLCLILSVCMIFPVKAGGGEAISGRIRIDSTYYQLGTPASGENWSYDGERTLTLDGFDSDIVYFYPDTSLYEEQILNVNLVGENKTNYLGIGNEYYDCYRINVIGNGSIDVATGIPKYMDITSGEVTIYSTGGRYVNIKENGELNVYLSTSGVSLLGIDLRARVSGGTLNVFTTGRYLTWMPENDLRIVNGGTVNVSTNGDEYYGGIETEMDHFWSKYVITDFSGNPTVKYERGSNYFVAAESNPEVPLNNIRIVGGEVDIAAEKVTLNKENVKIQVGKQFQLTAAIEPENTTETITWESQSPSIATVDENGIVTGVQEGFTYIYGTLTNGKTISCYVTIGPVLTDDDPQTTTISNISFDPNDTSSKVLTMADENHLAVMNSWNVYADIECENPDLDLSNKTFTVDVYNQSENWNESFDLRYDEQLGKLVGEINWSFISKHGTYSVVNTFCSKNNVTVEVGENCSFILEKTHADKTAPTVNDVYYMVDGERVAFNETLDKTKNISLVVEVSEKLESNAGQAGINFLHVILKPNVEGVDYEYNVSNENAAVEVLSEGTEYKAKYTFVLPMNEFVDGEWRIDHLYVTDLYDNAAGYNKKDDCTIKFGDVCTEHSFGSWKQTKAPTCTKAGSKQRECKNCGEIETKSVAKLGHSYKSIITKATLTKNGEKTSECTVCGYVASKTTTIYYPKTIKLSTTEYTHNGKVKTPSVTVKDSKGNTLKKDTDYTVTYESGRKLPGKYTVTIKFKGKYQGTKKLSFTVAPKVTSKVSAAQTTATITLKWNKVTGADGYRIYQYNSSTKKYEAIKNTTGTSYKISKLKAGTSYKFKVRAYTKDDGTILGGYSSVLTTATKPKAPSITKISSTKGKASLTWSNVAGETGYQVYYSTKKDSGFKEMSTYKVNVVKGSKSKLTSKKTYYFKVRAYKTVDGKKIYSAWSTVKSIKIK